MLQPRRGRGFTLIEVLVTAMIIGILAAVTVPLYFRTIERSRFVLAKKWVIALSGAQERRLARAPFTYYAGAVGPNTFDVDLGPIARFNAGAIRRAPGPSWRITMRRIGGPCPPIYGCYTVTYNSLTGQFTSANVNVTNDLIP